MGSKLSIHNNTSDVWYVKIGADQKALGIGGIVASSVAALATVLATAGTAAPLAAALEANAISIMGISAANLTAVTAGAATAGAALGYAATGGGILVTMSAFIEKQLEESGMERVEPGGKCTRDMTLSLWRQGTCTRTRINPDNANELLVETLYMRPIFSGATDGSEKVYEIQDALNSGIDNVQKVSAPVHDSVNHDLPFYFLKHKPSGRFLDGDGGKLYFWDYSGTEYQQWCMLDAGDGFVYLRHRLSNKVLDGDGGVLHFSDYGHTPFQHWRLEDAGDGLSFLRHRQTNKVLDGDGSSLFLNDFSGTDFQKWARQAA